jgi:phage major head subunit gpT-like protein
MVKRQLKRLIYYKRKYITYATVIQVHDENILIQEITNGLSAKQYISKYLPKGKNKIRNLTDNAMNSRVPVLFLSCLLLLG